MHTHLKEFLVIMAICVPVGLAIGLVTRKANPEGARKYAIWSATRGWKFWALSLIMFIGLSVLSAIDGNWIRAAFFSLFAAFDIWLLVKSLSKHYPDENELTKIREADFTRLWPLWPPKPSHREPRN